MAHTATCMNTHMLCGAYSNLYEYAHPVWDIQPIWVHTSCMGHTTCMNTHTLYGTYNLYEHIPPVWGIQPPVWIHTHPVCGIQPPVWRYTHILYGAYSHLYEYTHPVWGIQPPVWIHTSCTEHTAVQGCHDQKVQTATRELSHLTASPRHRLASHLPPPHCLVNQQASETSKFVTAQTTWYQAVFPLKLLSMLSPVQLKVDRNETMFFLLFFFSFFFFGVCVWNTHGGRVVFLRACFHAILLPQSFHSLCTQTFGRFDRGLWQHETCRATRVNRWAELRRTPLVANN